MDTEALAKAATQAALGVLAKGGDNLAIYNAVKGAIDKASGPRGVTDNQVVMPTPPLLRADSVLETLDGAGDRHDDMGPPVKVSPYKPPRDPRVQGVLKAAAAAREADKPTGKVFTDPRLEPGYGKKKK